MGGGAGRRRRRSVPPLAVAIGAGRPCRVRPRGGGPCLAVCRSGLAAGAIAATHPSGLGSMGRASDSVGRRGRTSNLSGSLGRVVGLVLWAGRGGLYLRHGALARRPPLDFGAASVPFPAHLGAGDGVDGGQCISRAGPAWISLDGSRMEREWRGSFRLRRRRVQTKPDIGCPSNSLSRIFPRAGPPRLARDSGHAGGSILAGSLTGRLRGPGG